MNVAASKLATIANEVALRGDGPAEFVFAEGNNRSIELSFANEGFWVEYWEGLGDVSDHEYTFHSLAAATEDAIRWLTRSSVIDEQLPCPECGHDSTLRHYFDSATHAIPGKNWLTVPCCCGATKHLRLQPNMLSVGILDGFPAPSFMPTRTISLGEIRFETNGEGIRLHYQSLSWFILATR